MMTATLPKTTARLLPAPAFVGQRHAAGLVSRTAWQRQPTTLLSLRHFTPSAATKTSLTDLLQSEIDHETETYQPPEELAGGPPSPWQLTETPDDTHMTLSKSYNNEELRVDITVNEQPGEDESQFEDPSEQEDPEVDVGIVFNATVIKGDQALVFECKSDGEYLEILHVSLENADEEEEDSVYTGPVYSELDEKLLMEFPAFLEKRGITPEFAGYLLALVSDKEQREYTKWLGNVKTFLNKR